MATTVLVDVAAVVLDAPAPTLVIPCTVLVGVVDVVLAEGVPTVHGGVLVPAGPVVVALSAPVPSPVIPCITPVGVIDAGLSAPPPTVTSGALVPVAAVGASLAALVPVVRVSVPVALAAVALDAPTPSVVVPCAVSVGVAGASLAALVPVVRASVMVAAGPANVALGLPAPTVRYGQRLPVPLVGVVLGLPAPTVRHGQRLPVPLVDVALALQLPTLAWVEYWGTQRLELGTSVTFVDDEVFGGTLTIEFRTSAIWQESRTAGGDREDRVAALGYRPCSPLLVAAIDVVATDVLDALESGDCFLVSNTFIEDPLDPLYILGARRAYIGTKMVASNPGTYYVFRAPEPEEVVWYVEDAGGTILVDEVEVPRITDHGLYRYYLDDEVWRSYPTLPERMLKGQAFIQVMDPSGVYMYFARLLGAMHAQLAYDNHMLGHAFDPLTCPEVMLAPLGAQYGLTVDYTLPAGDKRGAVEQALPIARRSGQDDAVYLIFRSRGYLAHVGELWVDPRLPPSQNNWTDQDAPPGLINPLDPAEGAGPPAAPQHRDAAGNLTVTIAAKLAEVGVHTQAWSGWKGTALFEVPHGYLIHNPAQATGALEHYWPTSLVALHVNARDGHPMNMQESAAAILALREEWQALCGEVGLPAHAAIRYFATDYPVAGLQGESLGVADTLVVTRV